MREGYTPHEMHGTTGRRVVFVCLIIGAWIGSAAAFFAAPSSERGDLTDAACLECHQSDAAALVGTAHDTAAARVVSCRGCHAGIDPAHLEDPEENPAPDLETMAADSLTRACATCHAHPHTLNLYERDPHEAAGLSCNACHRVHDNRHLGLLIDDETNLCFSCHPATKGDFAMPSHHPVLEGVVACRECHIEVAQSAKQRVATGTGNTCTVCHARFQGPYPFEHAAAVEYSTEEGGCNTCHAAHGSAQPRLLKQPYDGPDFALCAQCHVVPGHQFNANHGAMWAGVPCSDCHVDVHGSYESKHLLDPSLATQGCFLAGCHQL